MDCKVADCPHYLLCFWKKSKWKTTNVKHPYNSIVGEELNVGTNKIGPKGVIGKDNRFGFRSFVNLLVQDLGPFHKLIGCVFGLLFRQTFYQRLVFDSDGLSWELQKIELGIVRRSPEAIDVEKLFLINELISVFFDGFGCHNSLHVDLGECSS